MTTVQHEDDRHTVRATLMIRIIGFTALAACSAVAFVGMTPTM